MNNEIICIARFVAKKECIEKLKESLVAMLEPTRNEEGCLSYHLNLDTENSNIFTMIEKYKNQEAYEYHGQQPHLKNLRTFVGDLAESIEVNIYKAIEI
ncbi:putative quinol monooxygenase [Shewanella sp. AC91-MNA-CIBAN-0169]|uniref:putative quinol monooxygenase n=1 Tax=Shewanella TaxID=22 RepID=UPI0033339CF5|tara:strand:- start:830 stop:1126 length:297 start_codon:yes stop_codon:yes gene_type:complete